MGELMASHLCHPSRLCDAHDLGELKEVELSPAEHTVMDGIVWKKLDRLLLPLCTSLFVLSVVDWGNIANSRVAGLQQSIGMSDYQFTIALTMTFASYIITEFPSTLLLKYVGPDIMLPIMVMLWGAISAFQGLVNNPSGLIVCRFFLGMAEGGIFPAIVLYLSLFYPRKQLQFRISAFFATTTLCGTFSGLLAAAIDHINEKGGKPGWAWIFILEGIFTVVFGAISFFFLPRSPSKARFLTEKERIYVVSILKCTGSLSEDDRKDNFSWTEVINALKSPHVWFLAVVCFFSGTILFGLAYFEPTIVAGLGYSGNRAQLMSVPPFATTFVLSIISGIISDRYQCRGYTVIVLSLLQVAGFTLFYVSTSNRVRYGSLFLSVSGTFCAAPTLTTWISNNSAPHTRRATAIALISVMTEVGGIFSTWLLGYISPAPNYTAATITYIVMSIGMVVFSVINLVYLRRANHLKMKRRERMGMEEEPVDLGDRSAWFIYSL